MYFQIDPPGSDYTRVQIDVPKGQLEAVIRAVTAVEAEYAELERAVKSTVTAIKVVLEDEDACRRVDDVDDVDQDGPDCEGPEGGESA
ncbi:hypothetical protein M3C21_05280 [Micrococcus luteus]|uniref:hypothetical protein n=1 Tax=Micrococcus luteus TaxID=1270 RepID=UPI0037EE5FBE|nr:hypothetical protein [Micrococcus luteus]